MVSVDTDSPLVVYLEAVSGTTLTKIESWSIDTDYMTSTDAFEFTVLTDSPENLRGLEAQPVLLTVAGVPQLVGRIDQTTRGDNGCAVQCQGRDYISDMVECNIDPTVTVDEGETLGDLILKACGPIGITKIAPESDSAAAIDVRLGIPGKTKRAKKGQGKGKQKKLAHQATLQNLKPSMGQGIYEFLKPLCDHHHCTIQPTLQRDTVLLSAPHYDQEPAYSIVRNIESSASNNVMSASVTRDYSSFPTITIVQGQGAPRTGEPVGPATQTVDTWAEAQHYGGELGLTLNEITYTGRRKPGEDNGPLPIDKIYRLNVFRDDRARTHDEITAAAKRLFCDHLRRTLSYRVKLRGHLDPVTGAVWTVNTIVRVADAVCDIHEDLWIQSRRLSFGPGTGPITELLCIRRESFDFQPGVTPAAPKKKVDQKQYPAHDRFYNPQNYANPFTISGLPPGEKWDPNLLGPKPAPKDRFTK